MTTDPVCEFYTQHPYPPPVDNLDRARDEWRDPLRHRAEFHLFWPGRPYRADLDILVAGCGTWQAAKYAVCRPEARIVGIDVSATSIDHTESLKQKYGLTNLEIHQCPIERVEELERQFDLIVCTGVLHHLADPEAGLRALRSVLRRDGAMYLMVYAPYGRAGIYVIQEYCRRLGIGPSNGEIEDLVATLGALPTDHPLAALLHRSRDAGDDDALADALLNPRDRAYSVPQFLDFIERNGLTMGRWYWQAPYVPQCGTIAATPHAKRLAGLPDREQHAALELLRGTMTSHSAVVGRNDGNENGESVRFDAAGWKQYVPLRFPWSRLVKERLPEGAAGVLLNRSHQFHDLVMVLGAPEVRLFEGIDGCRTIPEIVDHTDEMQLERARAFFERLWWHDLVVFDTSRSH